MATRMPWKRNSKVLIASNPEKKSLSNGPAGSVSCSSCEKMIQTTKLKTMPAGIESQSLRRPKPRAVKAKRMPVAIEKPAVFRSSIWAARPATIQMTGATS